MKLYINFSSLQNLTIKKIKTEEGENVEDIYI